MPLIEQLEHGWKLIQAEKFKAATEVFQGILNDDPEEPDALQFMGQIAFAVENLDAAEDYLTRSLKADPNQYMTWIKLGGVFNKTRRHAEAREAFENAIKFGPNYSEGYCQLGIGLLAAGNKKAAEGPLRQAIMLDDNSAQAFRILANSYSLKEDDPAVNRAQAWLKTPNLEARQKAHLLFGLAYMYEKNGQDKDFFEHLHLANQAQFSGAPAWRPVYLRNFSDIKVQFTPATMEQAVSKDHKKFTPIFIVGIPRSGSTLTEQIITAHPKANGVGEVDFMTKFAVNQVAVWTKQPFLEGINQVAPEQLEHLASLYQGKIQKIAPDYDFVTDKFLSNFWTIGLIKMILPWARVIHVARNPMDNALSIYRNFFTTTLPYCNNLEEFGEFYVMYRDIMDFWKRRTPNFVCHVAYENLVENFEEETRRIIDFCGLPWDPACLAPHKNPRQVMTLSQDQVRRPVFSTSIGKWKKYRSELAPVAKILAAAGIDPEGSGL